MEQRVVQASAVSGDGVPLVVDLDGTLLATDTLHEGVLALLAARPLRLASIPFWLAGGRAAFKERIADESPLAVDRLPVRPETAALLATERAAGRPVWLATAANRRWAEAAAAQFGPFDGVLASDGSINLAGRAKADALVRLFGERGFDYVGDSAADLAVWPHARRAIVVGATRRVRAMVSAVRPDFRTLDGPRTRATTLFKALRPHQWAKNLLVFLPALAAQRHAPVDLALLLLVFIAFGLAASAVYLCNDLLDLSNDRDHDRKRMRPFASGALPLDVGLRTAPVLFAAAFATAAAAGEAVAGVLAVYVALTFSYSLWLKRQPIIDVMTLAGLYTLRVVAGAAALSLVLSPWMLGFCVLLFLCLALVKRLTEIRARVAEGRGDPAGRGYRLDDAPVVLMLAAASGYAAVVVLALYIESQAGQRLYSAPTGLWVAAGLLLFWISRAILIAQRGDMHDDPIVFAARDRVSGITAGLILLAVFGSV